jgi:hypothetical protein
MKTKEIAQTLGSDHVIKLKTQNLEGPFTYLSLIKEVNLRIAPKVGRPTDIKDTAYHNIPLTEEIWKKLKQRAKMIPGKKTLPTAYLAAFLIEQGLERLEQEIEKYDLATLKNQE